MRTRTRRLVLAAGATALSLTLLNVGPAAVPAGASNHPPQSLAAAGSDTTYWMMKLISGHYVSSSSNTLHDKITMIPPTNHSPFPASVTVPKDFVHGPKTWDSSDAAHTPPDGSSAGITALNADTTGQIAWARSSRGPNAGETSDKNFWAYALGAVDFVKWSGSRQPAAGLTQNQLIQIYTCDPTTHAPFISDWSQIPGGTAGPIKKYIPQSGSGTRSFVQSKLLNGATIDANCDASHMSINIQEHDARGVAPLDKTVAIFFYDWARWRAQKKKFEADLTNGSALGKFGVNTPVAPTANNVNEKSNRFYGTRYVFNVVRKKNHPNLAVDQFNSVTRLIGVRPSSQGGAQYICSGRAHNDIIAAGFVPLVKFGTGGLGLPSSFCRLNPKPL